MTIRLPLRHLPDSVYVHYTLSGMDADITRAPSCWRVAGRGQRRRIRTRARGLVHWRLLGALNEHRADLIDRIEVEAQQLGWWAGVALRLPAAKAEGFSIAEPLDDGLVLTELLDVVWPIRLRVRSLVANRPVSVPQ